MSTPYVGEIRMGGWNYAPDGWALCQGQLLAISDNETLFNLIGTTYGGDGMSTFALPDLRGRVPAHQGGGYVIGMQAGQEQVTISSVQAPVHTHPFNCSLSSGDQRSPAGNVPAALPGAASIYIQGPPSASMAPQSIGVVPGSGQPHDNMQPYLGLSFIIALYGIYPSPS